jgi:hypothetical protein
MAPKIQPDFSEEMTPNQPGRYLCKIISSEIRTSQSGNAYVNWRLETQPGKRTVFYSTPVTGRAAGMFKHFVHSAGDTNYVSGEYDTDQLTGQMVMMDLDLEEKIKQDGSTGKYFKVMKVEPATIEQLEQLRAQEEQNDIPF